MAPIDVTVLILVAMMCTWSVHSYVIAVSRVREAKAIARKRERRVRLARMWRTRDLSMLWSCIVIHVDPITYEPIPAGACRI